MDLLDLAQLFNQYGFEVVMAVIILSIYLRHEHTRSKKAEAESAKRSAELERMVEELLRKIEATGHLTPEQENLQSTIEQKIDRILEKLRDKTGAGRALLIRYHNGGKDLAGNSFLRFSCTNEKVSTGITSSLIELKNQFRSLIGPIYDNLKENDFYSFENINTVKEDGHISMYEFFKSRNIISLCTTGIKTRKGYNLGFIAIEFLAEHKTQGEVEQALEEARDEISLLLSLKLGG